MTRFSYFTATSIDGFIADEANSLDWLFAVADADPEMSAGFMETVGVQVMGSTTYRWLLEHEHLLERPERWTEFFGDLPTKVFSSRELPIPAGAAVEILNGDVAVHEAMLVDLARGKDVWIVGGGDLAGQFLDAGLLDRISLTVAPVTLGAGAPLLPRRLESDRLSLQSVEAAGPFARLVFDVAPPA